MLKMLTIASMSLALATGAALAQTATPSAETPDQANNSPSAPSNLTEEDTMMMEGWSAEEGLLDAFFMDDTMAEMRSEEEIAANWANLSAEQQEMVKASCEQAMLNRGVHGNVTISLCTQVGEL